MTKAYKHPLWIAIAALAASACSTAINGPDDAITYREEHPITVDSQAVTLTLPTTSYDRGLSSVDEARLRAFADAYLNKGHGPVTFTASTDTGETRSADVIADAQQVLYDAGVPRSAMTTTAYVATANGSNDVVLSYTHYVATPSACGVWSGVRKRDFQNLRSPNFGCAAQNNLAAMVADPRDLVRPADMTAPDSQIRIRGVQSFREGEVTSSARDAAIATEVSQ
ncbi:MAG: CpaD family pilus assembly protein [Pseudomonadota bacterium]